MLIEIGKKTVTNQAFIVVIAVKSFSDDVPRSKSILHFYQLATGLILFYFSCFC